MSEAALLVLEALGGLGNRNQSVLLEGLEQDRGDFNIYYSNFYEKRGFNRACETT